MTTYKLSDATIIQISRLVQMAILTGTDVVDNLRTLVLHTNDNGTLDPDPEFIKGFEEGIQLLLHKANALNDTTSN
jgi:hypothetical protein